MNLYHCYHCNKSVGYHYDLVDGWFCSRRCRDESDVNVEEFNEQREQDLKAYRSRLKIGHTRRSQHAKELKQMTFGPRLLTMIIKAPLYICRLSYAFLAISIINDMRAVRSLSFAMSPFFCWAYLLSSLGFQSKESRFYGKRFLGGMFFMTSSFPMWMGMRRADRQTFILLFSITLILEIIHALSAMYYDKRLRQARAALGEISLK